MRPRTAAALTALTLLSACNAGHRVYHASVAPEGAQGVYYALPRAVLEVSIDLDAYHEVRGPCADEAALKASLGLAPPVPAAKQGKPGAARPVQSEPPAPPAPPRIALTAAISSRAEPDPDEIYLIDLRGRRFKSAAGEVNLTRDGVLTGATITAEDHALEIGLAVTGAALDLTTKALGAVFAGDDRSGACGLYANRIRDLRGQRQAIYGGTWQGLPGGIPRDTLDRVLAGIDAQEAAITDLFVVREERRRRLIRCAVTPRPVDPLHARSDGRELVFPLLTLDRATATVSAIDPAVSCEIPADLRRPAAQQGAPGGAVTVSLTLQLHQDDLASRVDPLAGCKEAEEGRCLAPQGLFYRVPRHVTALVWWAADRAEVLTSEDLQVPQLGATLALPADAIKKRSEQGIELYPDTGALKSLNHTTTSHTAETFRPVLDRAGGLVEAAAGAAARDDQLSRLERERARLEEEVRIKEAREKLGLDRPGGGGDGDGGGGGGGSSTGGGRVEFPPLVLRKPPRSPVEALSAD
jgi:uncharacterized membrane protein YgcG